MFPILERIFGRRKDAHPIRMKPLGGPVMIILRVHQLVPSDREIAVTMGRSWTEVAGNLERKIKRIRPGFFALDFIEALSSLAGQLGCECVGVQSKYGQFQITRSNL